MISRTVASVFPRQPPSSLISSSINAEADSTGTGLFMYTSNSRSYFSCAQRNLNPPQVEASSGSIAVRKDGGNPRARLMALSHLECIYTLANVSERDGALGGGATGA